MDVTDENFNENVIEKSKETPVIVDFWAEWCHPCKVLKPILEKLEGEYAGKFVLAKVDVENGKETAGKYGVSGIPAVKMFKDGEIIADFVGSKPEDGVKAWLDENL
ncbi:thioredoxin [Candidatus Woesearchaeota archaeon]|jgi:putative thioredoxin|nr:thioredoxin [Candidatus Woesearchaeota archaeon]MBT5272762.1 thioredoxin [Candidatus Woesearchaeota archaeon]MBT6040374.1 thioredoxin [Candidatus Woesearchaeota archaeon]MBT6336993.1 thioredoxin [Candidatus Woesearchaeota archaeon]MBT7926879.1 thioredoxin [Candidatus Woesearchaeota archaeon]